MFSFLKKIFKPKAPEPRLTLPRNTAPQPAATAAPAAKPAPLQPPASLKDEKPGAGSSAKAKEDWAKKAASRLDPGATPESLCGILPTMSKEDIAAQLAMLYRRHNRAASSLAANLREEAEIMLDVIAAMKQKYLDS